MSYIPSEIGSGPIELVLTLDADGPALGETPTVRVREMGSLDRYLDFADQTFKTAGWTTRDQTMVEVAGDGTYRGTLDPGSITNLSTNVFHLIAEYRNGGSVIPGAAHDVVSIFDSAYKLPADTTNAVWDEPNSLHQIPGSTGDFQDAAGTGANFRGAIWSVLLGGTATTIPTNATRPDGFYNGMQISVLRASGEVVARNVQSYAGGVFTVDSLPFIPTDTDQVEVWRQTATGSDQSVDLDPIYRAIDELLRKLSQVGVNIRAQIVAPTLYAGHKGDRLEVVVYQDAEPIDDATLSAANALTMRIQNLDDGTQVDVVGTAVAGGIIAYTLVDGDGVMDSAAQYRVQGVAELASATDTRYSEQRIYNVAEAMEAAPP